MPSSPCQQQQTIIPFAATNPLQIRTTFTTLHHELLPLPMPSTHPMLLLKKKDAAKRTHPQHSMHPNCTIKALAASHRLLQTPRSFAPPKTATNLTPNVPKPP